MQVLKVGTVVEGSIQGVKPYGAFVELEPSGLVALLHVSQISAERVKDVSAVFSVAL